MPRPEYDRIASLHQETFLGFSSVRDLTTKRSREVCEVIESFNISQNLREFARRVIAQFGSRRAAPLANVTYFGS
jgi:hypothetical protein